MQNLKTIAIENVRASTEGVRFIGNFEPIYSEKLLGLFKRSTESIDFEMYSPQAYQTYIARQSRHLGNSVQITSAPHMRRHFFTQTDFVQGQARFLSISDFRANSDRQHYDHVLNIGLNVNTWSWAVGHDLFIELLPNETRIYRDGELMEWDTWEKLKNSFITTRKNLYEIIDTALQHMPDFSKLGLSDASLQFLVSLSDLHVGDKSSTDNFGEEKARKLIQLLKKEIIAKDMLLLIPGDLLELWQAYFPMIREAYPELWATLRQVKKLFVLGGNHDNEIVEKPDVRQWFQEMLPNAVILPFFYGSFKNMDVLACHGHAADPFNIDSRLGKIITKSVMLAEWAYNNIPKGRNSAEQELEGGARKYFLSTRASIDSEILNYFNNFQAQLKIYDYVNRDRKPGKKRRKLLLLSGHTHEMVRHRDPSSPLQQFFYEYLPLLYRGPYTYVINDGGGSGENLYHEHFISRSDWEKRSQYTSLEELHIKVGQWQAKPGDSPREDWIKINLRRQKIGYQKSYLEKPVLQDLR